MHEDRRFANSEIAVRFATSQCNMLLNVQRKVISDVFITHLDETQRHTERL